MEPIIQKIDDASCHPDSLVRELPDRQGLIVLRSAYFDSPESRYSIVAKDPFLECRFFGNRVQKTSRNGAKSELSGNPWNILNSLLKRYKVTCKSSLPLPIGGCFGFWGYELRMYGDPILSPNKDYERSIPDAHVFFYDNLVIHDHLTKNWWIVSTGLNEDGSTDPLKAKKKLEDWRSCLQKLNKTPYQNEPPDRTGILKKRPPLSSTRNQFQCHGSGVHKPSERGPKVYPSRRHLSGKFVASIENKMPVERTGIFQSTIGCFSRSILSLPELRFLSTRLLFAGKFFKDDRIFDSHFPHQGDTSPGTDPMRRYFTGK